MVQSAGMTGKVTSSLRKEIPVPANANKWSGLWKVGTMKQTGNETNFSNFLKEINKHMNTVTLKHKHLELLETGEGSVLTVGIGKIV